MKKIICSGYEELSRVCAALAYEQIITKPNTVLGLATGSTPIGMYTDLVELHRRCGLDFSQVVTFNLDEYVGIKKSNNQSYDYFMWYNLFSHINIKRENVHIPNGESEDPHGECLAYERSIAAAGGIDMQILGIGNNGHIGFNEPEDNLALSTHVTKLTTSTIEANSRFFASISDVPTSAMTMGMGTIMASKKIVLIISGEKKSEIARMMLNGKVSTQVPASFIQLHPDATLVIDEAAASLALR